MNVFYCSSYRRLRPVLFKRLRPTRLRPTRLRPILFACQRLCPAMGRKRKECPSSAISSLAIIESQTAVHSVISALNRCSDRVPTTSMSWCRKLAKDVLYADATTDTPYGKVCVESIVNGSKGPLTLWHLNPFAFLYHACTLSAMFASFLFACTAKAAGGILRFVIYLDKAVPGNDKRADGGRATQCVYWSCLEFPAWFRSRRCGWMPFTYILQNDLKHAGIIDSQLMRLWVHTFDNESVDPNITAGFVLPNGDRTWVLKGRCCVSVADWEQHVRGFNLIGYNGIVPCGVCKNVLGRRADFNHPVFVHISSHEYHRFQMHTPESFFEAADEVQRVAEEEPARLAVQQTSTGIKFHKKGLIFDKWLRNKLQPPMAMYVDWMHTYCSSGGVLQYHLNQFVLYLEKCGFAIADIDTYMKGVTLPRGMSSKIPHRFFENRVRREKGAYLKAFAADVMTALVTLGLFIDAVVMPLMLPELQEHIQCFMLARIIIALLQRGDLATLDTFQNAVHTHHILFKRLYPDCLRPKLHNQAHISMFWWFWGVLLSCYAPERRHRLMKRIMGFSYDKPTRTVMAYDIRMWLQNIKLGVTFEDYHLSGNINRIDVQVDNISFSSWSLWVQTPIGMFGRGDLLQWSADVNLGFAIGFAIASGTCVAMLNSLQKVAGNDWEKRHGVITVVRVADIIGAVPYTSKNGLFSPMLISTS